MKSKLIIDENGSRFWRTENEIYHRIGGPSKEWYNGDKAWDVNGKKHR